MPPIRDSSRTSRKLGVRDELVQQIAIKGSSGLKLRVARRCGITQPRMSALVRTHASRFSLNALVNIASAIGRSIHMEMQPA